MKLRHGISPVAMGVFGDFWSVKTGSIASNLTMQKGGVNRV